MDRTRIPTPPEGIGALIDRGPDHWQILQRQADGTADVRLAGRWRQEGLSGAPTVHVRVVLEDSGEAVVSWRPAQMGPDRGWNARLSLPEGGPYRIETCLRPTDQPALEWSLRGDMIRHVGVGDVFVIAGQSNSAGYGKDPAHDPPEIGIHLLAHDGRWRLAVHPFNESTDTIHPANREIANPGHSPWLAFARRLRRGIRVPIGLVQAALGGSPLSAWNPDEDGTLYRNLRDILAPLRPDPDAAWPLRPDEPRLLAGVLWYQGESDTGEGACDTYLDRFTNVVAHLRRDLGDPGLPWITVQLGRLTTESDAAGDTRWGKVREAQRQAARRIPRVGVVPAVDLPLCDLIHIASAGNLALGERAARVALGAFYGLGEPVRCPEPEWAVRQGRRQVRVRFACVPERMLDLSVPPSLSPYRLECPDGRLLSPVAIAWPDPDEVVLDFGEDLAPGCRLHGAHGQNPYPVVPVEVSTRLPQLCFYGVSVGEETGD